MARLLRLALVLTLALPLLPGAALAHPSGAGEEGRDTISFKEEFPGEGVGWEKQHPGDQGHLDPRNDNVSLLGKARMTPKVELDEGDDGDCDPEAQTCEAPVPAARDALTGRIADVAAYGDHAYLTAFREPVCDGGGFFVVDISDPANPVEVEEAFRPAAPGNYAGEGAQVIDVDTDDFTGQIFLHNNEVCDDTIEPNASGGGAGISLWDVTDPTDPQPLAENFGDSTAGGTHSYHSAFAWTQDERVYLVGVDNEDVDDIDIFDITDPRSPVLIAETGLPDFPQAEQDPPPHGNTAFHHDVVVQQVDGEWLMLASYWDAGFIILNVDDPSDPQYLRATDFADVEPFADELGLPQPLPPEGNAHQAEFSPDGSLFVATDEDFNPYRILAQIASGEHVGDDFSSTQGSDTPQVTADTPLTGATVYVGLGCNDPVGDPEGANTIAPAEDDGLIALIARGACTFTEKVRNAEDAGYAAAIVFNSANDTCGNLLNMSAEAGIPALFVNRGVGLQLTGVDAADPCTADNPAVGTAGATVDIQAVFDGWGYVHLFDTETMEDLGQYAIEESLDEDFAEGFGDLSVHEVAVDPNRPGIAYLSYYSGGFRVIEYDRETGIAEIGAFIDEGGSNFWGVEFHTLPDGQELVLASDRDYGIYIFDPTLYDEAPAPSVTRVSGATRIETAVAISQASYGADEAATVVLARADIEPDALAGTPLAVAEDGPLLLTGSDALAEVTAAELSRVLPAGATVHLLGGSEALAPAVEAAVVARGFDTVRVAGATRIETAVQVAGLLGDPDTLLVTTGYNFPDALAAGAAAGHVGGAVLLTTSGAPHPAVDAYLGANAEAAVFAVGGPAAAAYPQATAVVGPAREETAVAVAEAFFDDPTVVGVARRDAFPDALAGGAHISRLGGPMLLTATGSLHPAPSAYICGGDVEHAFVYGGTAAISQATVDAIAARIAGEGC
jgi:hypothetical protein